MFIIPVGNRVDWKRPPIATLLLIVVNCFVFFFFQAGDDEQDEGAAQYYFSTKLPQFELLRYSAYLKEHAESAKAQRVDGMTRRKDSSALWYMEGDTEFMHELHAGRIIKAGEPEFAEWRGLRKEYESRRSFTSRYIARVDDPSFVNATVSAFMHGGFDHLLGNMVVLFLVGFLVEAVIGEKLYLLAYAISIYTSEFVYGLTAEPGSGGLGASGAIAGVMGLYAVIFGFRKIDFFYTLGFYFDYVRAPAIVLLPLWLGNELYQFLTDEGGYVAYMAHFGGLLGGALMGGLYRWKRPVQIEKQHEVREEAGLDDKTFRQGMDYLGAMEFKKALDIFKKLHEKHPHDLNLVRLIFRASKPEPASADFHDAALRLLTRSEMDGVPTEQTHAIFHEYLSCAKPAPRLGADLTAMLAKSFAGSGYCEDAERLADFLHKSAPDHGDLPGVMLALGRGYYRQQRKEKSETILKSLIDKFPQSKEAMAAADMLRAS